MHAAGALADTLKPWERILFLSHTNSARDEIRNRLGDSAKHVVARTLDAFALEVLSPYATLWGLPDPLRPPRRSDEPISLWFADVRKKAARLLTKTPALAHAVVCRFPLILADEHQDASRDQHALVMALVQAGARVRFFGDALQGIMLFAADVPGWDALVGHLPGASLTGAWRWKDNPGLGRWITTARSDLVAGRRIDLSALPDGVEVVRHGGTGTLSGPLREYLRDVVGDGDVVVLVRSNADALALVQDAHLRLDLFEGSNLSAVDRFLNDAVEAEGDPRALLDVILMLLSNTGRWSSEGAKLLRAGLDEALEQQADSRTSAPDASAVPLPTRVATTLLEQPRFPGVISALRTILRESRAIGWTKHSAHALGVLNSLPEVPFSERMYDAAYAAQQALASSPMPRRCVSTIHKAKGRQFPHAVVASAGRDAFGRSREDRNLFYVAISRPTERLTLVIPSTPSPLLAVP